MREYADDCRVVVPMRANDADPVYKKTPAFALLC